MRVSAASVLISLHTGPVRIPDDDDDDDDGDDDDESGRCILL